MLEVLLTSLIAFLKAMLPNEKVPRAEVPKAAASAAKVLKAELPKAKCLIAKLLKAELPKANESFEQKLDSG